MNQANYATTANDDNLDLDIVSVLLCSSRVVRNYNINLEVKHFRRAIVEISLKITVALYVGIQKK